MNRVRSTRMPSILGLCAALLTLGCLHAHAKLIHDSSDAAMAHRAGRAGVLVGSVAVEAPAAWRLGGDPIVVTFDEGFTQRTNMPRDDQREPPVRDRTSPIGLAH